MADTKTEEIAEDLMDEADYSIRMVDEGNAYMELLVKAAKLEGERDALLEVVKILMGFKG